MMLNSHEIKQLSHKDQVRFALFCANQVRSRWAYLRELVIAFEVIEEWLDNKVTYEQCQIVIEQAIQFWNEGRADEVNQAPYHAINCVTSHEKSSAGYALFAASAATNSVDTRFSIEGRNVIIQQQIDYYTELRYIDDIFEKTVLSGNA